MLVDDTQTVMLGLTDPAGKGRVQPPTVLECRSKLRFPDPKPLF